MSDWTKPTTTSNYSTAFIQELDARLKDLAYGLDPSSVLSYTGVPANAVRINWSGASVTLDTYNGTTTWTSLTKTLNMTATAATALATARNLVLTGDLSATLSSFNGTANVTATATLTSIIAATSVGTSTTIPVVGINTKGQVTSLSSVAFANAITAGGSVTSSTLTLVTGTGDVTLARLQSNAAGTLLYLGNGTSAVSFSNDTLAATLQNKTLGTGCVIGSTVTGSTPAVDNSSTLLATTAYVLGQLASVAPLMAGTAAVGTSTRFARQDHVHPTDTTRAPTASPTFTGNVSLTNIQPGFMINVTDTTRSGFFVLQKGSTVTSIGNVTMDVNASSLRIYESAASKGVWIDLATCSNQSLLMTDTNLSTYAVTKDSAVGAALIPSGTTAQRPTGALGKIRINTDNNSLEFWNNTLWASAASDLKGGGSDKAFFECDSTITTNYTITTNKNAMTAGPITVNNGITVTVPNGSTWTIV